MNRRENDLEKCFYPRNLAIVGVSPDKANLGKNIVGNLLAFGYEGEILSIGLRGGVVFGQRIYPSLEDIDHPVDLAVLLTPAKTVPGLLEACGKKGIRNVVIESGGFSERGEDGLPLEKACVEIAEKYHIRFIGPNGIGITNLENGLALPFMPLNRALSLGPVSILAQSGGVGLSYLGFLIEEDIGINKFVSMGNKLNVDENDLLSYLMEDDGTKIILIYLEGFKDGRRFVEIASRSKKPILVHKSNRFKASASIAHSHTAALFTDDQLVDHALEQANCVRVNTMDDAIDYVKILTLPPLKGNRLAVVSRSGGHAVIAADACAHYGFELPPFPKDFLERIESHFRAKVIRLQNPLDLGDLFDLTFYENIVEEMLKRDDVDGVLLGHGYRKGFEQADSRLLIQKVNQLVDRYQKPVAVVIFTEAVEIDYLRRHSKIPIFTAPENAMRAFHLSHRWTSKTGKTPPGKPTVNIQRKRVREILRGAKGRSYLTLVESLELMKACGFPVPEYHLASSPDQAVAAWHSLQRPVALKINHPHISHKTDQGGILLDLNKEDMITEGFVTMKEKIGAGDVEVLVQPMVEKGREVILGGRQDAVFGPVLMFGLGGIFVEALGDVVWRVAPIHQHDARAMITGIRGSRILRGIRGEKPSDLEALEDLLLRLSQLLVDFPVIREIDVNPVKVMTAGEGTMALDARVILSEKPGKE
ncbi:MAG: acetate--CoA ligase family protein [Deltaproteobacteria bacterium]|nr:acetate--CoA ligase family protein [Deltaproteobacteria bacterium]